MKAWGHSAITEALCIVQIFQLGVSNLPRYPSTRRRESRVDTTSALMAVVIAMPALAADPFDTRFGETEFLSSCIRYLSTRAAAALVPAKESASFIPHLSYASQAQANSAQPT